MNKGHTVKNIQVRKPNNMKKNVRDCVLLFFSKEIYIVTPPYSKLHKEFEENKSSEVKICRKMSNTTYNIV